MRKIFLLIILLLFAFFINIYSQDNREEIFKQANDDFNSENYIGAINNYEILIDSNTKNSTIYYNLALSYLKNKDLGKAMLNTERALRISPRNKLIRKLKDYIYNSFNLPQQNFVEKLISNIKLIVSINELTIIMLILFVIISALLIAYFICNKKVYFNIFIIFAIWLILLVPIMYIKYVDEIESTEAIIIKKSEIRNKPIKLEEPIFDIEEGRKVVVLSELGRWANVELLLEGLNGWVDKRNLEKI